MKLQTLPQLLEESVDCYGDRIFLSEKIDGAYRGSTYREIHLQVQSFAAGLQQLGLQPGDRVALIAEGCNRWVISEFGIFYTRGISVPLSIKLQEDSDLAFRIIHSGCRMAVVSGTQAPKLRRIGRQLPSLDTIILLDGTPQDADKEISFAEVMDRGCKRLCSDPQTVERSRTVLRESDPACICYTSGTTADPKGIVLTHGNFCANVEQCCDLLAIDSTYTSLLLLPWDHSFTHTAGIFLIARKGASLASVETGKNPTETLRNLSRNLKETRPSFLFSVPALAQSFIRNIERGLRSQGKAIEILFRLGLKIAYIYNREGYNRGQGWRKLLHPLYRLFDHLIFRRVREGFGGRLLFFIGGGALLDMEPQRFFYALGIPMFQGYGLTEAAPVISANTPARHKLGSSGLPATTIEVSIRDENGVALPVGQEGEITIRGENVMAGYWNNPVASRQALRDGRLFTGDRGYLDADGFLFVLGRYKSLLINSNGEKYSPEGIEEAICNHSPFIEQIMLHNDHYPHTVAFLFPHRNRLLEWLQERHLSPAAEEGQSAVLQLLQAEIGSFRSGGKNAGAFPSEWVPAAVAVLDEPFTEQNRMLNSTLKMVRRTILKGYDRRLQWMLTPEGRNILHPSNRSAIASLLQEVAGR